MCGSVPQTPPPQLVRGSAVELEVAAMARLSDPGSWWVVNYDLVLSIVVHNFGETRVHGMVSGMFIIMLMFRPQGGFARSG